MKKLLATFFFSGASLLVLPQASSVSIIPIPVSVVPTPDHFS
jgi:hypothetical protein